MREIESLMNFGVSNSSSWLNSNGFKNVKPCTGAQPLMQRVLLMPGW